MVLILAVPATSKTLALINTDDTDQERDQNSAADDRGSGKSLIFTTETRRHGETQKQESTVKVKVSTRRTQRNFGAAAYGIRKGIFSVLFVPFMPTIFVCDDLVYDDLVYDDPMSRFPDQPLARAINVL